MMVHYKSRMEHPKAIKILCSFLVFTPFLFSQQHVFSGPLQAPAQVATVPTVLQSKQIDLAKAEIERVSDLVKAGALPRVRLEDAEEKLADAQDDVILSHTLYGDLPVENLSEQLAADMVAAAQRRVERQTKKVEQQQKLVGDGVIAQAAVRPFREELELRRMNLSLAHTRSRLISELASIARYDVAMKGVKNATYIEPFTDYTMHSMVHFVGSGGFLGARDLRVLESAFTRRFEHSLPISADGQTSVHNALGFDHHGRVDIAVNPNDPEGIWLRKYLEAKGLPYYAFLRAVPGKATGAHIHIGPGSTKLHNAD